MAAPRKCTSTDAEFRQAVAASLSVRQLLGRLGLVPAGSNYKTVPERSQRLQVDTSHFTGATWNQGNRYRAFGKASDSISLLVENSPSQSFKLKKRLLKAGLFE